VSGRGLDVVITSGAGTASTEMAAFDAALQQAGVAHIDLIRLSSLLPPGSRINVPQHWSALAGAWGDRLYAVDAEHRVSAPGERACAGLGWVQNEETGAGGAWRAGAARWRLPLVGHRTALKNRIHATLMAVGHPPGVGSVRRRRPPTTRRPGPIRAVGR
jgi:hypothetical protein